MGIKQVLNKDIKIKGGSGQLKKLLLKIFASLFLGTLLTIILGVTVTDSGAPCKAPKGSADFCSVSFKDFGFPFSIATEKSGWTPNPGLQINYLPLVENIIIWSSIVFIIWQGTSYYKNKQKKGN